MDTSEASSELTSTTILNVHGDSAMEASEEGLQSHNMWSPRQGGFRAAMFVFIMTGIENIGFVCNMVSLVLYFSLVMHFDISSSATTLTNFLGSTFLLTIVGGFLSDTYITRLNTVLIFGSIEILGYIFLTLQAHYDNLRPDTGCLACHLQGSDTAMFYLSLSLLAIGYGGVRGALPSLGADQFDRNDPKERRQLASFFNWFVMSITIGATIGVTVIVWVSINRGWDLGFLISMVLALVGFAFVAAGKPFYRLRPVGDSPLVRVVQVVVVALRNRKVIVPESSGELYEITKVGEERLPHTQQFRWLDKAAVLTQGTAQDEWKVCSVTQVEETKILVQMVPIIASTILMNTCLAQLQTLSVEQGNMMDLHLGSFQVPAASIPVIPLIFMSLLIPLYEIVFIPFARRFTGHPTGITHLQRIGVGLVLCAISMAISAMIEVKRKDAFNHHGEKISLFWLSFQYGIFGVADMFTLVGMLEFFYSEAPSGMRSLSTSFTWVSLSLGYFMSSILVQVTDRITSRVTSSGNGWLHGQNLNENFLDLFYWFLAILSCINFAVYLLCAKWYKYRNDNHEIRDKNQSF